MENVMKVNVWHYKEVMWCCRDVLAYDFDSVLRENEHSDATIMIPFKLWLISQSNICQNMSYQSWVLTETTQRLRSALCWDFMLLDGFVLCLTVLVTFLLTVTCFSELLLEWTEQSGCFDSCVFFNLKNVSVTRNHDKLAEL